MSDPSDHIRAPALSASSQSMETAQILSFTVGPQTYGLDVTYTYSVERMVAITELPDSPPDVLGVIDYRGTVIPVIELRIRFGLEPLEHTLVTPIVVAWTGEHAVGLIVDEILGVLSVPPKEIMEPEDFGQPRRAIAGVATRQDGLLLILNPAGLVGEALMQVVNSQEDS